MSERNWLVVTGLCAFFVFLVARLPAAVAVGWIGSGGIGLAAASGTLWSGAAGNVTVGPLRLGETSWSLSPAGLVRGQLRVDVQTRLGDGKARGAVARSLSGVVSCTACRFEGPASALWPVFPALKAVSGRLDLQVATLEVRGKWPTRVVATAELSNSLAGFAATGGAATPAAAFQVSVNADPVPEGGAIEATVQDAGGPVQLSARLTITPPGNFQFTGRVKARPDAPAEVVNAVAALGARSADGSTELSLTGTF